MKIDAQHLNTIKRLVDAGYTDEKAITALSTKQVIDICRSLQEVKAVVALQEAITQNCLLSYLIKKEP